MSGDGSADASRTPLQYMAADRIDERYEVIAHLGSGGAADVYRVYDDESGLEFVLKLYNTTIGDDAALRELKALLQVSDLRHIVRVFDIARTATAPPQRYLKMEYIEGTSLQDLCAPGISPQEPHLVHSIGDQLLAALETLHPDAARIAELEEQDEHAAEQWYELQSLKDAGLVHRDVKPDNLILRDDGVLKLLDFNISARVGAEVRTQSQTPAYSPPDLDWTRWDVSVDLFAAAVVLFELLAHTHPFPARQTTRPHTSIGDYRPDLAPSFDEFFSRGLAPERAERFQTAAEMRDAWSAMFHTESEREPAPNSVENDETVLQAKEGQESGAERIASQLGFGKQYAEAQRIADRHGLGARGMKQSLMLSPPGFGTTTLINLGFGRGGQTTVWVPTEQWTAIYGVSPDELARRLGPGGDVRKLSPDELSVFLQRMDALLAECRPTGAPVGRDDKERIVSLLESHGGDVLSSEEIGATLDISKRRAGKLLSNLVSQECPTKYAGRVTREAPDRYRASPRRRIEPVWRSGEADRPSSK